MIFRSKSVKVKLMDLFVLISNLLQGLADAGRSTIEHRVLYFELVLMGDFLSKGKTIGVLSHNCNLYLL